MDVKISVVIPAYNREKTIKRCLLSVLNQTVQPYEILVVDDGSVDRTVEIIESMQCSIIRVLKQNHKGAQAARNIGILNARGNYISFLDSDDEWKLNKIEKEMEYLTSENTDFVIYSDCYVCKGSSNNLKRWRLPGRGGDMYDFLLRQPAPTFSALIVPKRILLSIGLLDENVPSYQEWDTSIRLAKKCKFIHIEKPLFTYYLHTGETISKDPIREIRGYEYIVKKHLKSIVKRCGWNALEKHYIFLYNKSMENRNFHVIKYGIYKSIVRIIMKFN